jgi:glycyl-tRNA synthetase
VEKIYHSLIKRKNERWVPYVIEPAAGVDRCTLTFMMDAFTEDESNM